MWRVVYIHYFFSPWVFFYPLLDRFVEFLTWCGLIDWTYDEFYFSFSFYLFIFFFFIVSFPCTVSFWLASLTIFLFRFIVPTYSFSRAIGSIGTHSFSPNNAFTNRFCLWENKIKIMIKWTFQKHFLNIIDWYHVLFGVNDHTSKGYIKTDLEIYIALCCWISFTFIRHFGNDSTLHHSV